MLLRDLSPVSLILCVRRSTEISSYLSYHLLFNHKSLLIFFHHSFVGRAKWKEMGSRGAPWRRRSAAAARWAWWRGGTCGGAAPRWARARRRPGAAARARAGPAPRRAPAAPRGCAWSAPPAGTALAPAEMHECLLILMVSHYILPVVERI